MNVRHILWSIGFYLWVVPWCFVALIFFGIGIGLVALAAGPNNAARVWRGIRYS